MHREKPVAAIRKSEVLSCQPLLFRASGEYRGRENLVEYENLLQSHQR
jgi:hypothetical protein